MLDLGAGIGGPARYLARKLNCRVDGIDLTPEFVAVARSLTARVGLADRVTFHLGSILALPFPAASFAAATLLHVGMNIADKPALCAEAARVLVPGGVFVVYDVMRTAPGDPAFPVPWASRAAHSFLATPDAYRAALAAAGLLLVHERERRAFALDFFARPRARGAAAPPPLGTHLLMGADAATKIANFVAALHAGILAPVEMIARKPV
jgi:SAM-dependent methyltransferase